VNELFSEILERNFLRRVFGGESVLLETRRTRASREDSGARRKTEREIERNGEAEAEARLRRAFQFARQYFRRTPAELGVL